MSIEYIDEEPIEDEVEVICSSCGAHFFILREHFEEDLNFEEHPEYTCLSCDPEQITIY